MSNESRFPAPSESSKRRASVRRFSRAGASALTAALVTGSAMGLAAQSAAQAEGAASTAAVVSPASAPDGVLGSFGAVAPGLNDSVFDLELTSDDTLFIGGDFTGSAQVDDSFITSWSLRDDTYVDVAPTSPLCSTVSSTRVFSSVWHDDTLYVGGSFNSVGGVSNTAGIAALSGGQWSSVSGGTTVGSPCYSVEDMEWLPSSDSLYAAGVFKAAGGFSGTYGVASWSLLDDTWSDLDSGMNSTAPNYYTYGVTSIDDSVFFGGQFNPTNDGTIGSVAEWAPTGAGWLSLNNTTTSPVVRAIDAGRSRLYAGGFFNSIAGVTSNYISQWDYISRTWSQMGTGVNNAVYALEVDSVHDVAYVGGDFTALFGGSAGSLNRVAAWDIQTSTWIPLSYSSTNGVGARPRDFAFDDSAVYIGGEFTNAGGVGADYLVKWTWDSPQGSVDDTVSVDDTNIAVAGEGFIGVQAVTLDDTSGSYPVTYTIDDTANITITSLGSTPGGSRYDINVDAVGGVGTVGTLNVNPAAPSAPQTPAASAGNASATVTWAAPASTGGSAILSYDVTSSPGGLTCSATPPTTSCVVTGLTNGTAYTFDITATNAIGTSTAATTNSVTPVNPTPPTPPTPTKPGAPTNVSGVAGDGQVAVTWQAPADSGTYPITDYQVTASPGGATCLATAPTLACTVDGLTNGTAYTFTVAALSGAGWGPDSAPSPLVTPVAPRNPTITITGSRSQDNDKRVYADGITTDLVGEIVQARVHLAGEEDYYNGSRRTVQDDGTFTWTRKTNKKVYLFFRHDETRSNRIIIDPRPR